MHVHPQGREKNGGWGKIYGGSCKCTSRQNKSPIFEETGEIWTVGVDNLVVLACLLTTTTTKKRSSTFSGKKSAPPRKDPGYAYKEDHGATVAC